MTYNHDEYVYDDEYDAYDDEGYRRHARAGSPIVQQAFDWGISGSILAIIALTILYTFFPLDVIPDVIPVAGQIDDIAAILAGGSSVTFLAALRFILRTRIGRWGCLLVIILSAIGAFTIFWLLMQLFNAVL